MSQTKTNSLIHANIYTKFHLTRFIKLRRLCQVNMWLFLKITKLIPTLFYYVSAVPISFVTKIMLENVDGVPLRTWNDLDGWVRNFCSLWMGRENWPVGQHLIIGMWIIRALQTPPANRSFMATIPIFVLFSIEMLVPFTKYLTLITIPQPICRNLFWILNDNWNKEVIVISLTK